MTFGQSSTLTITNTWTINGAAGQKLKLRSSTDGTQWDVDPQGTRAINNLDVKDSNNISGTTVNCFIQCTDSTGNTDWDFGASLTDYMWIGDGGSNLWNLGSNWSGGSVPSGGSNVAIFTGTVSNEPSNVDVAVDVPRKRGARLLGVADDVAIDIAVATGGAALGFQLDVSID